MSEWPAPRKGTAGANSSVGSPAAVPSSQKLHAISTNQAPQSSAETLSALERYQKLGSLVSYLLRDLKIARGAKLLDATRVEVARQRLGVPDALVVFTCMFIGFDVKGDASTKRQLKNAMATGEPLHTSNGGR